MEVDAQLNCVGQVAQGSLTVTNNGPNPVVVTTTVDGTPVGPVVPVGVGTSVSDAVDLSAYEDQTITVGVMVDGAMIASYTATPDCSGAQALPRVSVVGQCLPPTATVTLSNDGDPASAAVFVIRVNGRVVQRSAPLYGGDTTTIVADLSRFEDRTAIVSVASDGDVLGVRKITVNCQQDAPDPDPTDPTEPTDPDTDPGTDPDRPRHRPGHRNHQRHG